MGLDLRLYIRYMSLWVQRRLELAPAFGTQVARRGVSCLLGEVSMLDGPPITQLKLSADSLSPRYIPTYSIDKLASPLPRLLTAAAAPSRSAIDILSSVAELLAPWSPELNSADLSSLLDDAAALAVQLVPVEEGTGLSEKARGYDRYFEVFRCTPPVEAFAVGQVQALRAIFDELARGSTLSTCERGLLFGGLGVSARIARDWWRR